MLSKEDMNNINELLKQKKKIQDKIADKSTILNGDRFELVSLVEQITKSLEFHQDTHQINCQNQINKITDEDIKLIKKLQKNIIELYFIKSDLKKDEKKSRDDSLLIMSKENDDFRKEIRSEFSNFRHEMNNILYNIKIDIFSDKQGVFEKLSDVIDDVRILKNSLSEETANRKVTDSERNSFVFKIIISGISIATTIATLLWILVPYLVGIP